MLDEALVWAAKSDRVEVLQLLVELGARVDADPYRGTPLTWAAANGRVDSVRKLVELGADANQRGTFGGPDHGEGVTALHLAAQAGRREAVEALLELGADPTIRDALHDGRPPAGPSSAGTPSSPALSSAERLGERARTSRPSATAASEQQRRRRGEPRADVARLGAVAEAAPDPPVEGRELPACPSRSRWRPRSPWRSAASARVGSHLRRERAVAEDARAACRARPCRPGCPRRCASAAAWSGCIRPWFCLPSESSMIAAGKLPAGQATTPSCVERALREPDRRSTSPAPSAVPESGTSRPSVSRDPRRGRRSAAASTSELSLNWTRPTLNPRRQPLDEAAHRRDGCVEPGRLDVARAHRARDVDEEHDRRVVDADRQAAPAAARPPRRRARAPSSRRGRNEPPPGPAPVPSAASSTARFVKATGALRPAPARSRSADREPGRDGEQREQGERRAKAHPLQSVRLSGRKRNGRSGQDLGGGALHAHEARHRVEQILLRAVGDVGLEPGRAVGAGVERLLRRRERGGEELGGARGVGSLARRARRRSGRRSRRRRARSRP